MTIRRAVAADRAALDELAALDGIERGLGPLLLAEVDGEIRAALELETCRAFADPFQPTAGLTRLLAMRARDLAPDRPASSGVSGCVTA